MLTFRQWVLLSVCRYALRFWNFLCYLATLSLAVSCMTLISNLTFTELREVSWSIYDRCRVWYARRECLPSQTAGFVPLRDLHILLLLRRFLAGLQSNSGLWIDDVRLSVRPSTFWLTSAFKFVLGHIYQYRLDALHGNRPWWDLLNCDLSLWPWPSLFLFKVT